MDIAPGGGAPPQHTSSSQAWLWIVSSLVAFVGAIAVIAASNSSNGIVAAAVIFGAGAFGIGRASVSHRAPLASAPPQVAVRRSRTAGFAAPPPAYAPPQAYAAPPMAPAQPSIPYAPPPPPPAAPVPQWAPPSGPPAYTLAPRHTWQAPPPPAAPPRERRAPRPSLRQLVSRFVSAHAILLLSYLGAFLLIVSALLFLLYGPQNLPGGARLATVAGVNGILAVAAFACRRRTSLHLVSASYTALAALMTPVTFAAAYEFVLRYSTPLNGVTAVAMTAGACAVLYGLLARSIASRSYASLSLLALATGGVSAAVAWGTGPAALPAGAAYTVLCWVLVRSRSSAFALPAHIAGHVAAAATIGAAIGFAAYNGFAGQPPLAAYLPISLAAVAAAYVLFERLQRNDIGNVIATLLVSTAAVTASQTLGYEADGAAAALVAVGFATVALSRLPLRARTIFGRRVSGERVTHVLETLAAVELMAAALSPITHSALQLVLLPLTAVGGAVIATRSRSVWALCVGLVALVLQVSVHESDQSLLPVAPGYIAATLATGALLSILVAVRIRSPWPLVCSAVLLVLGTMSGGSTLGWHGDQFAIALTSLAALFVLLAFVQSITAPLSSLHHSLARRELGNPFVWVAVATVIAASSFAISDPALQFAVLGAATACGLIVSLRFRSPAWLATGLAALAAQTAINAMSIAGAAPAYVPATLGMVLAACVIDGVVRRDRRMALAASALLILGTITAGSTLIWQADQYADALAGVALACAAAAWLLPTRIASGTSSAARLDNAGGWIAVTAALVATLFVTTGTGAPVAALGAAVIVGLTLTLATRSPWWLLTGVVGVVFETSVHAPVIDAAGALPWYVPGALAGVLMSVVITALVWRDRSLILPANLALTVVAMTANSAASLGATGYGIELVAAAYLTVLMASFAATRTQATLLQLGAGARLVIGSLIVMPSHWGEAGVVAAAMLCAVWLAVSSRRSEWTYLAGAMLAWSWYWAASAAGATTSPADVLNAFSPLPFVYLAAGAVLSRALPRAIASRWILAPLVFGITAAVAIDILALVLADWTVLAWSLFAEGVILYAIARPQRIAALVPAAAAAQAGAAVSLLLAVNAPLLAYPLALALVAWFVRVGGWIVERDTDDQTWALTHRWSALGVALVAVAAPIVNAAFAAEGDGATMSELAASLSLAVLIAAGVTSNVVRDRCAALVVAAFALEWLPVFFGVHEVQAYVVLPAVVTAACGVFALHDRRVGVDRFGSYAIIAVSVGVALVTTLVQMTGTGDTSLYTAWMLIEGIACVAVAIVLRLRVLAVIGGAAVLAAALRALVTAFQDVPLYAVFGVAAVLIMVLATVLATQRARLHDARESLRAAWGTWD